MTTYLTADNAEETEIEVDFYVIPGSRATRWDPEEPADIQIESMTPEGLVSYQEAERQIYDMFKDGCFDWELDYRKEDALGI